MRFFLFSVLLFSSTYLQADMRFLKNFQTNNPLSYQYVKSIKQDTNGFMWFGTLDGLHRYDGHEFNHYHHDAANPNSLAGDTISDLLIDRKGQLWVATRGGGISLLRQATNDFVTLSTKSLTSQLSHDNVNVLLEDSLGNIWAGTEYGLNHIRPESHAFNVTQIKQQLGVPMSLSHNIVTAIIETQDHEIWVGTNGGAISIFNLDGQFKRQFSLPISRGSKKQVSLISALLQDSADNIWIGTVENGLFKYEQSTGKVVYFQHNPNSPSSLSSNSIEALFEDSTKRMWVATDKGFLIRSVGQTTFDAINQTLSPYSLNNDFVLTFFEDNNNMMWIGTYSGVNRWDSLMTTFKQYNALRYPSLKEDIITGFAQDNNERVIFSTYSSGLYQLALTDSTISPLPFADAFKNMRIMTLFNDGRYLWVGTRSQGAYRINLIDHSVVSYIHSPEDKNSISANSVTDIIKDKYGLIWISTYHQGLNRLNNDGTITRFLKSSDHKGPNSNHILQIVTDRSGDLWLATYGGGINKFNYDSEQFISLTHQSNEKTSISSNLAWILSFDDQDNLWIGTQSSGINILSAENIASENYRFQHIGVKDGLKSQTIYGISQDRHGKIWFSSNKGISNYLPSSQLMQHFDGSHGLEDLEYNHGSMFISRNKTLYFGSAKGFISIDPNEFSPTRKAPVVKLTDILTLNESVPLAQSIHDISSLSFNYSDRLIAFEYVGLNYIDPMSTRYKYRLLGFDQQWIDAGTSRRATYTNLPQGDYRFEVIASNRENVWSPPSIGLEIIILPAPWRTWWAYLIYTLVGVLLLISYARIINRRVFIEQQQKALLTQQVKEKTQEFLSKNIELEEANKQLENVATIDKQTRLHSRIYLDIYIEQASLLLSQMHQNILPVQRQLLPRLYLLMIRLQPNHQENLLEIADLLLYSRNTNDLVVRWSEDAFMIIGYEKDDNARELAQRVSLRLHEMLNGRSSPPISYTFYPFDIEQPMALSWDQVSVLAEAGVEIVNKHDTMNWFGLYSPKSQPFNYLDILRLSEKKDLVNFIRTKHG